MGARITAELLRRSNAGNNVLALGIDQEFAKKLAHTGRWIPRESNTRCLGTTHIAKDHGLHVNRSTPGTRDIVQTTIGNGALVHPRSEHRAHRAR